MSSLGKIGCSSDDDAQEACHENQFLVNAAYLKEARSTSCFQELSQTSQVLGCPLISLELRKQMGKTIGEEREKIEKYMGKSNGQNREKRNK